MHDGEILGLIHGHYVALRQVRIAEERAAGVDRGAVSFVFVKELRYSHRMTPADADRLWWQMEQIALENRAAPLGIFDNLY